CALPIYHLAGFRTTIPFCRLVLDSQPFRSGDYSTFFVKEHWPIAIPALERDMLDILAAAGFALETERRTTLQS
ncbi:MAG TPA: biotin carboxylase, partial [Bacteroidetes bacterium]|nr:biotin carboxylase [Bacteroidota bacterium]